MGGRLAHLGLATLFSYRLAQERARTFSITVNDYGFALLSPEPIDFSVRDLGRMLAAPNVQRDILAYQDSFRNEGVTALHAVAYRLQRR